MHMLLACVTHLSRAHMCCCNIAHVHDFAIHAHAVLILQDGLHVWVIISNECQAVNHANTYVAMVMCWANNNVLCPSCPQLALLALQADYRICEMVSLRLCERWRCQSQQQAARSCSLCLLIICCPVMVHIQKSTAGSSNAHTAPLSQPHLSGSNGCQGATSGETLGAP